MTLIPALTKLFGKASWYLPKWLGAVLPNVDVIIIAIVVTFVILINIVIFVLSSVFIIFIVDMTFFHRQHHYDNQRDDIDYESLYTQDGDHTYHDERNYNESKCTERL
jgi:RND superfamily putative drug exporter